MPESNVNAILAVGTRIAFYREMQFALDDWLRAEPSRIADYRAAQAQIDVELIPLLAELEALAEGEVSITPPDAAAVAALQAAVQRLSARIAAAKAAGEFMTLIADAATEFRTAAV